MPPEEWRDVPGWPGYQVSDKCRVRKVRLLTGGHLVVRVKDRQITTTAGALYKRAFAAEPLTEASMIRVRKPGDLSRVVVAVLSKGPASFDMIAQAVLKDDKDNYSVVRRDTRKFRTRLSHTLTEYVRRNLIVRAGRNRYQLEG